MKGLKTLIVEDDKTTQILYKHGLNEKMFEIRLADTGQSALDIYQEWAPDIVLLDIGLPDIDGISVLRKIREELKDLSTTIIIASSLADREHVVECMKTGIHGFIVKPIHTQTISEKILQYHNRKEGRHHSLANDIVTEMSKYSWSNLCDAQTSMSKVPISLGIEVLLEIKGIDSRLRSFVTGLHHGEYLLIQCPRIPGIETKLYEGNRIRVVYLHDGTVCAFKTQILNFIRNPSRLIFLSYPDSVDVLELRKNPRISCFLKASVRSKEHNTEYDGVVLDINSEGCRFATSPPSEVVHSSGQVLRPIHVGEKIEVTVEFAGPKESISFLGVVRNIAESKNRISMGIQFAESNTDAITTVDNYIKTVLNFL